MGTLASDSRFQISDLRFQISYFRFQISDLIFQISDLRFQISDLIFVSLGTLAWELWFGNFGLGISGWGNRCRDAGGTLRGGRG